jgi:hypothetical protein
VQHVIGYLIFLLVVWMVAGDSNLFQMFRWILS